ncbi:MAG: ABC transporter substrate-binding protein [Oscillospiraceae bacterium]
MKRFCCMALAVLLLLCACGPQSVKRMGWPVSIDELSFSTPPKRVVTLSPGLTETVFSLGYGARVSGVGHGSDYPSSVQALPDCGTATSPDVEMILELSPALVLTPSGLSAEATSLLANAGIPVMIVRFSDSLEGIYQNWGRLCLLFEGTMQGPLREQQLRYYGQGMLKDLNARVHQAVSQQGESVDVIWLRHMPLLMATGDTLEGSLLADMGLVNQAASFARWNYPVESEKSLNPDLILCDSSISLATLQSHAYYKQTNAMKNNRVFTLDGNVFERQTPLMFSTLYQAMQEAFPDAFANASPAIVMPPPPAPEVKKSWLKKLLGR